MIYRLKPYEVEAMQFTGKNIIEILDFLGSNIYYDKEISMYKVKTANGHMALQRKDYIIIDCGKIYLSPHNIFEQDFEKIN